MKHSCHPGDFESFCSHVELRYLNVFIHRARNPTHRDAEQKVTWQSLAPPPGGVGGEGRATTLCQTTIGHNSLLKDLMVTDAAKRPASGERSEERKVVQPPSGQKRFRTDRSERLVKFGKRKLG